MSRLAYALLLALMLFPTMHAWSQVGESQLPDGPGPQTTRLDGTESRSEGSIRGTVVDPSGAVIAHALVTLEGAETARKLRRRTDDEGGFEFTALAQGEYAITVEAKGFSKRVLTEIKIGAAEKRIELSVELQIAKLDSTVEVSGLSPYELAEEQMRVEERQRVFGVMPNFYIVYAERPAALTATQKMRLAWRTSIDPYSFAISGLIAESESGDTAFKGYGGGAAGFGLRFGAAYGDTFTSTMIGAGVLPALLHQDPRYYYKGSGAIHTRIGYALATPFRIKGDNGRWQPNYSYLLGNLASGGISNLYYPASAHTGLGLALQNAGAATLSEALGALLEEFLLKKVSTGVKHR